MYFVLGTEITERLCFCYDNKLLCIHNVTNLKILCLKKESCQYSVYGTAIMLELTLITKHISSHSAI